MRERKTDRQTDRQMNEETDREDRKEKEASRKNTNQQTQHYHSPYGYGGCRRVPHFFGGWMQKSITLLLTGRLCRRLVRARKWRKCSSSQIASHCQIQPFPLVVGRSRDSVKESTWCPSSGQRSDQILLLWPAARTSWVPRHRLASGCTSILCLRTTQHVWLRSSSHFDGGKPRGHLGLEWRKLLSRAFRFLPAIIQGVGLASESRMSGKTES